LAIVLFMGFVSGLYPSFYLSAFQPAEVLKGQVIKGKGADLFRKSLVTIQYSIALILIICTFIVIQQMGELKTTKLNEQGSQLLSIRFGGIADQQRYETFKRSVLEDPEITHVTMANHLPRLNFFGWIGANVKFSDKQDKPLQWNQLNVEYDFAATYNLDFVAGRDFQVGNVSDSNSIIMNQAAIKAINKTADQVIGTTVIVETDTTRYYNIIGIVKDFPFRSMHQPIEPLLLSPKVHRIDKIVYVKLPVGKFQEKIAAVEKKWKAAFPNTGFDHWFLSDEFNRMYLAEGRVSALAKSFAILAIVITVLGVFGLASYTAEQRTKEMGIRKVLGAGEKQIISLFAGMFLKIFAVACVLSIPIAWYVAHKWLQGFAYRTAISPMVFALSLLGLLLVTLLTIGFELWKSARAKPVVSLRTE
jgi:putative ABC transport system permease protein